MPDMLREVGGLALIALAGWLLLFVTGLVIGAFKALKGAFVKGYREGQAELGSETPSPLKPEPDLPDPGRYRG